MLSFFNRCAFTQQRGKIEEVNLKECFMLMIFKLLPYLKTID